MPIMVAVGERTVLSCVGEAHVVTPARWALIGHASGLGSSCDLGIAATTSATERHTHGTDVVVHGRDAGPHTIQIPAQCTVTISGADDQPVSLPVHLAPTAQSGATSLFTAHGVIRVATSGPTRCNATLFDDTGTKLGHQAVPGGPLDINVNGTYWVVAEQNDCVLDVTELKAA